MQGVLTAHGQNVADPRVMQLAARVVVDVPAHSQRCEQTPFTGSAAARGVVDVRKLNGDAPAEAAGLVQSRPISFHLVTSSPNLVLSRPQSRPVSPEVQYSACRQAHAGKRSKGSERTGYRQRESGQRAAHWIGLALLLALPLGDAPELRRARAQERVERRKSRLGERRAACFCGVAPRGRVRASVAFL